MKIETVSVFTCDYCGKKQFRKCDMSVHEKWCKLNPNNQHKCFQYCKHLIKTEEEYEGTTYDEVFIGLRTIFTCDILKQGMYSFIAERRKLPIVNEENTVRMPLECDKYKDQNFNDVVGITEAQEDEDELFSRDENDKYGEFRHEKEQQGWPDDMDEEIWDKYFR
jgi:hypothetical protein